MHLLSKEEEEIRKTRPSKHPDKFNLGLQSKLISMEILTNPVSESTDDQISFFKITLGGGTTCDLNGLPRLTEVEVF